MKKLTQACTVGMMFFSGFVEGAEVPNGVDYPDFNVGTGTENTEHSGVFQVTIDPRHRTQLAAEVPSPVKKISKRLGENFKKDDILIQLDDTIYQSNYNKAKSLLEKAQTELEAKQQLFKDNVASKFELKEAESNVATAKSDLAIAQKNLAATIIEAPFDGKVVSLDIEEFELPQTGKNLIEIVDDKVLIAKILVPSSLLPRIKIGTDFKIDIKEVGKTVDAKISRIGSVIDPSSGTLRIEADIDNADGTLVAGMSGRAHFQGAEDIEKTTK